MRHYSQILGGLCYRWNILRWGGTVPALTEAKPPSSWYLVMASHQTIVVELGSSRIKVGFAGEPRPRRVLYDDDENITNGGTISSSWVNDGMVSNACHWSSFFHYYTSLVSESTTPAATATTTHHRTKKHHTTVYDWEKTLYPLFSHILTSILFISRPARHRIIKPISFSNLYNGLLRILPFLPRIQSSKSDEVLCYSCFDLI